MSDTSEPQVAAETLALVPPAQSGFVTGEAQGITDEDGYTSVLLDGPPDLVDDDDTDESTTNTAMPMQTLVRGLARGERCVVLTTAAGAAYALPFANGLIGAASIPGGETDIAVVSTDAEPIALLEVEAEVLWPGHLVTIEINAYIQSGAAGNVLIGRIERTDADGTVVEVGRFLRASQVANNETMQVGIPVDDVDPAPGVYTYTPTIQAGTTGWSIILDPSTTPETAASMKVIDHGPLPTGATRA